MAQLQLIECPRDAMQGIKPWIPTPRKIRYVKSLLKVGFDYLDAGSFVSPRAVPQMRDTGQVIEAIHPYKGATKLLVIVANLRGAETACQYPGVDTIGFPFSISENFQMRNTHKTINDSLLVLEKMVDLAAQHNKELVVYISMGFGNPYGDPWSPAVVEEWVARLSTLGIKTLSLSDTVGLATPQVIDTLFSSLIPSFPAITFGAHLHCTPSDALPKISAAYRAGCRRFDHAVKGYGGCPMAKDVLVGNLPTEKMVSFLAKNKIEHPLNLLHFESAYNVCLDTFPI